ncbi:MAG: ClbS/DfsB family four-helix bundle protein [Saprospiraceae bacterium]|nr:ClbS/DfsB family four-helix bundle protein [Saprospiraceae bacterium]
MPRPATKSDLEIQSQAKFEKLLNTILQIPEAQREIAFKPGTLNRNIRDVLMHLHRWHLMFLNWYETGMRGEKPAIPAPGYSWKTTPALNRLIWEEAQSVPLAETLQRFRESHLLVHACIQKHSDEELFEKKRYAWTGSSSLGAYLVSATCSHYDWAMKLIKLPISKADV